MVRRDRSSWFRKPRFVAAIGRFVIDAVALGSRIIIGEDPFNKR